MPLLWFFGFVNDHGTTFGGAKLSGLVASGKWKMATPTFGLRSFRSNINNTGTRAAASQEQHPQQEVVALLFCCFAHRQIGKYVSAFWFCFPCCFAIFLPYFFVLHPLRQRLRLLAYQPIPTFPPLPSYFTLYFPFVLAIFHRRLPQVKLVELEIGKLHGSPDRFLQQTCQRCSEIFHGTHVERWQWQQHQVQQHNMTINKKKKKKYNKKKNRNRNRSNCNKTSWHFDNEHPKWPMANEDSNLTACELKIEHPHRWNVSECQMWNFHQICRLKSSIKMGKKYKKAFQCIN